MNKKKPMSLADELAAEAAIYAGPPSPRGAKIEGPPRSPARSAMPVAPKLDVFTLAPGSAPQLRSWSLSTYKQWKTCPRQTYFDRILRIKRPESPVLLRGIFVHSVMEKFVLREIEWPTAIEQAKFAGDKVLYGEKALPVDLAPLKSFMEKVRKNLLVAEGEWAFNQDWSDGNWRGAAWLRMKLDAGFVVKGSRLEVTDWKTGRVYDDHFAEEDLYALAMMLKFPKAKEIVTSFAYLDQGKVESSGKVYSIGQVGVLKEKWEDKVKPMMNDKSFNCKPSPKACRYCHYRLENGVKIDGKAACRW